MKRLVVGLAASLVIAAPAQAQQEQPARVLLNDRATTVVMRDGEPVPQRPAEPVFALTALTLEPSADDYIARVSIERARDNLEIMVDLRAPEGSSVPRYRIIRMGDGSGAIQRLIPSVRRVGSARVSFDGALATLRIPRSLGTTPAWGIAAAARSIDEQGNGFYARTHTVPVASLTGEEFGDEARAWPTGLRSTNGAPDFSGTCDVPDAAAVDGFRAAVVRDHAVFTLHFRAPPGRVDSVIDGRAEKKVMSQTASVQIHHPSRPDSFVAVEFDSARKIARYIDATVTPPKAIASLKIDVLGQNVLLKTVWRFGDPGVPFTPDGTFGTLSPSALVRASSTIATADGACRIDTASVRFDRLAPRVGATPAPTPRERGSGVPPYLGLLLAFGGIAAIVSLAAVARRRAQVAGSAADTAATASSDEP